MSKLCPKCYFIGKGGFRNFIFERFFSSIFLGVAFIALGFYNLIKHYNKPFPESNPEYIIAIVIYLILLSFPFVLGIINIANYIRGGSTCPSCNHKPMLSLDNPEAIKLIKQHDLKPGENNVVKNEKKSNHTEAPTT